MKKVISILLAIMILVLSFSGCSGSKSDSSKEGNENRTPTTDKIEMVLNTNEYTLYQNIFYNNTMSNYDGLAASKEGIFATITDAYNNNRKRYYVWGYNDRTKCCDWQWELKIENTKNLPTDGSYISVSGTYEVNDNALDGFWIINPKITVKKEFTGKKADVDMQTLSGTLERVQIINIENFPSAFEGKTVSAYGRMKNDSEMEDPYYNGSWNIPISGDFEVPAFGTSIKVTGIIKNGTISDCKLSVDNS